MNTAEVLQAVRERLTPRDQWSRDALALDAKGRPVDPNTAKAVSWHLFGALKYEVGPAILEHPAYRLLSTTAMDHFGETSLFVNESMGHKAVLQLLDVALQMAQEEERL